MIIEEFVAALESYVRTINENVIFVLQKETEPCKFKAYKRFKYTLWYIDRLRNKRFPIHIIQDTSRVTTPEEEERVISNINHKFMADIFKFMEGEEFKLILEGSYEGDESIPNVDN